MNKLLTREEVRTRLLAQVEALEAAKGAFMLAVMKAQESLADLGCIKVARGPEFARADWCDYIRCDSDDDAHWFDIVTDQAEESARALDELNPETLDEVDQVVDDLHTLATWNPDAEDQGENASAAVAE